ncbi:podocalyxin [Sphaeramia orbicularis]|uniref:Podocalyxin n=1 Tax=Sphaeramia orbicularis TaxID=375764 RepID=A0A673CBL4_9TELE|nr:podocalyxin [Sphaeramia orbicularis]
MRTTLRITWLLLSLSLLIHVHSTEGQDATGLPAGGVSGTVPTIAKTDTPTRETTGPVKKNEPTTVTSVIVSATNVVPPATTVKRPATTKPADVTQPTQPQATTAATDKPTTLPSSGTTPPPTQAGANTAAVTPTPGKTMPTTAAPSGSSSSTSSGGGGSSSGSGSSSSSSSGVLPQAITTQASQPPAPGTTSKADAPTTSPAPTGNVETTKATKASSGPATTVGQLVTDTTISSMTKQDRHKQATEKTTVVATSHNQATAGSTQPTTNTQMTTHPHVSAMGGRSGAESISTTVAAKTSQIAPTTVNIPPSQQKTFSYSLNNGQESEEQKDLVELCRRLMGNLQDGNCALVYRHHNGTLQVDSAEINGKVKTTLVSQYFEDITKKPTDNKTLIAILASCGALLIMIVILAVCASHHRKPYHENQQHLTEELHTVENGYHDNPTLEVMEVQPEMQEKKMALNGEFNDSWIVPIDNLLKDDMPDEEDTHL